MRNLSMLKNYEFHVFLVEIPIFAIRNEILINRYY